MQLRALSGGVAGSDLHFAKIPLAAPGSGDLKGGTGRSWIREVNSKTFSNPGEKL